MSSQVIEALYATGHWLLSNGRHADAAEVLRTMTIARPEDERGWLALGACHEAIGQARIAIELYRIARTAASPAVRSTIACGRALRAFSTADADDAFDDAYELARASDQAELAELALAERRAS